ncbi:MAG: hypothetical protein ACTHJQ_00265 [Rhizobiaceae bacterium]
MADVRRLCELGLAPELAKEIAAQIEAAASGVAYTDAEARNAIKTKTEIAALVAASATASDIVTALQA